MKKNKKLIIISIIVIILIGILYMFPAYISIDLPFTITTFSKEKYKKVNDNLYYSNELIRFKQDKKNSILKKYKIISEYLEKNYPNNKFYVDNFNIDTLEDDAYIFILFQMVDNAVSTDTYVGLDVVGDKVEEENDPDLRMNHIHKNIKNKKAKIKVSKRELRKISMSLAKQNSKEMAGFPFLINGKYRLEYTDNKGFYYNVTLNKTSHVYIDTNGKVIDDYFFNGIYT